MNSFVAVCFLLVAAGLSQADCTQYGEIESAFAQASSKATSAIINAILSSSSQSGELYQAALAIFEQHAAIALKSGRLSADETKAMLDDVMTGMKDAEAAQASIAADAIDAIADAQREIIDSLEDATVQHSMMKREINEEEDFPITKEQLKEALAKAHQKAKEIVKKAVEKVSAGLEKVEGFLERMLKKVADSKVFQDVKQKIKDLIKKLTDQVSGNAEKSMETALDHAVESADSALYGLEFDDMRAKRAVSDVWNKVKAAVKKIGGIVYETALEVLEEKKPEIMAALDKLGKVLISAGKKIAIELAGEIVKASLA